MLGSPGEVHHSRVMQVLWSLELGLAQEFRIIFRSWVFDDGERS